MYVGLGLKGNKHADWMRGMNTVLQLNTEITESVRSFDRGCAHFALGPCFSTVIRGLNASGELQGLLGLSGSGV